MFSREYINQMQEMQHIIDIANSPAIQEALSIVNSPTIQRVYQSASIENSMLEPIQTWSDQLSILTVSK